MTTVYIIAGTKGGVGKTTAAVYFSNAFSEARIPHLDIDCDTVCRSFKRILKSQVRDFDISSEDSVNKFISLLDASGEQYFIIDLPDSCDEEAIPWLKEIISIRNDISYNLIGCISSNYESVMTFLHWAGELKRLVNYIVVVSEKEGENFPAYFKYAERFEEISNPPKINIPELNKVYAIPLNYLGTCLKEFLDGTVSIENDYFQGRVPRHRLQRYYNKIIEQIKRLLQRNHPTEKIMVEEKENSAEKKESNNQEEKNPWAQISKERKWVYKQD